VFTGHAALAVFGKRARPSVPIGVLLAASYGADVIDIGLRVAGYSVRASVAASHSLLTLSLAALAAGALYLLWSREVKGALLVSAVYLSHWPADFLTGAHKPLLPRGPSYGLGWYDYPVLDFVLEGGLLLLVLLLARPYIRTYFVIILLIVQLVFNVGLASDHQGLKRQMLDGLSRGDHLRERLLGVVRPRMALAPGSAGSIREISMAEERHTQGLVTLVCLTCGKEEFFDEEVPESLRCPTCSGTVFRTFATPTEPDEATIAQIEDEARSIELGDSSPETTADDVRDLDVR
jgi:DNA-directed RNA polymerase subunit RPC12/RpoP/membrane-bound metal-dependent hydrolase YbcI (DUF457 family)